MITYDIKSFIKYRISQIKFELLKKPITWIFIVNFILLFILWRVKLTFTQKTIIFIVFLLIIWFLNELNMYQTGEHRRWARDKLGIPSKSNLKKIIKDFKETKREEVNGEINKPNIAEPEPNKDIQGNIQQ